MKVARSALFIILVALLTSGCTTYHAATLGNIATDAAGDAIFGALTQELTETQYADAVVVVFDESAPANRIKRHFTQQMAERGLAFEEDSLNHLSGGLSKEVARSDQRTAAFSADSFEELDLYARLVDGGDEKHLVIFGTALNTQTMQREPIRVEDGEDINGLSDNLPP